MAGGRRARPRRCACAPRARATAICRCAGGPIFKRSIRSRHARIMRRSLFASSCAFSAASLANGEFGSACPPRRSFGSRHSRGSSRPRSLKSRRPSRRGPRSGRSPRSGRVAAAALARRRTALALAACLPCRASMPRSRRCRGRSSRCAGFASRGFGARPLRRPPRGDGGLRRLPASRPADADARPALAAFALRRRGGRCRRSSGGRPGRQTSIISGSAGLLLRRALLRRLLGSRRRRLSGDDRRDCRPQPASRRGLDRGASASAGAAVGFRRGFRRPAQSAASTGVSGGAASAVRRSRRFAARPIRQRSLRRRRRRRRAGFGGLRLASPCDSRASAAPRRNPRPTSRRATSCRP